MITNDLEAALGKIPSFMKMKLCVIKFIAGRRLTGIADILPLSHTPMHTHIWTHHVHAQMHTCKPYTSWDCFVTANFEPVMYASREFSYLAFPQKWHQILWFLGCCLYPWIQHVWECKDLNAQELLLSKNKHNNSNTFHFYYVLQTSSLITNFPIYHPPFWWGTQRRVAN